MKQAVSLVVLQDRVRAEVVRDDHDGCAGAHQSLLEQELADALDGFLDIIRNRSVSGSTREGMRFPFPSPVSMIY